MDKQIRFHPNNNEPYHPALVVLLRTIQGVHQERRVVIQALEHVSNCLDCKKSLSELSEGPAGQALGEFSREPEVSPGVLAEPIEKMVDPEFDQIYRETSLAHYPDFAEWQLLQKAAPQGVTRGKDKLRTGPGYLSWLTTDIQERIEAVLISLKDLVAQPPTRFLAHRSTDTESLMSFSLLEEPQLQAQLTIYPDRISTSRCWAVVEVTIPDRYPDFSGVEVIMAVSDRKERKRTGEDGRANFQDISYDELAQTTFLLIMPPEVFPPTK